jgi:hypothetical protein
MSKITNKVCETCGKNFPVLKSDVERGRGRFCSTSCVRKQLSDAERQALTELLKEKSDKTKRKEKLKGELDELTRELKVLTYKHLSNKFEVSAAYIYKLYSGSGYVSK